MPSPSPMRLEVEQDNLHVKYICANASAEGKASEQGKCIALS